MHFFDLCLDVRQTILSNLSRSDILQVSLSCKRLRADLEPFVVAKILCHSERQCSGQHRTIHGGLTTCFYALSILPGITRDTAPPLEVFIRVLQSVKGRDEEDKGTEKSHGDKVSKLDSSYTCLNVLFGGICKIGLLDHARVMIGQQPHNSSLHGQHNKNSSIVPVQPTELDTHTITRSQSTRKNRRPKRGSTARSADRGPAAIACAPAPLRAYDIDAGSDNGYSLQWAVRHTDEELVRFLCSLESVYPCKDAMEYAEVYKNRTITKLLKRLRMNRRHRDNVLRNLQTEGSQSEI